jgi:hypothetical protein
MDALKLVSAVHPKDEVKHKTLVKQFLLSNKLAKSGEPATAEALRKLISVWKTKADFVQRGRWLSAYHGSYANFMKFVEGHVDSILSNPAYAKSEGWKVYSREEMLRFYYLKYSARLSQSRGYYRGSVLKTYKGPPG